MIGTLDFGTVVLNTVLGFAPIVIQRLTPSYPLCHTCGSLCCLFFCPIVAVLQMKKSFFYNLLWVNSLQNWHKTQHCKKCWCLTFHHWWRKYKKNSLHCFLSQDWNIDIYYIPCVNASRALLISSYLECALWKALLLSMDVDVLPKEICQVETLFSLQIQNSWEGSSYEFSGHKIYEALLSGRSSVDAVGRFSDWKKWCIRMLGQVRLS